MVNVKRSSGKRVFAECDRDNQMLQDMAPICKSLRSSTLYIDTKGQLTEAQLLSLLANLRLHYESFYGKEAARPRPVVIPSFSNFLDFRIGGSVHVILATLLEGATVRDLLPLEKLFDNSASKILPLLFEIEKNLHLHGLINRPVVFLNRVPVGILNKLRKIAIEHGGRVVTTEDKATHIVDWNEDIDAAGGDWEETSRVISLLSVNAPNDAARVHFAFFPDAFDEVVPIAQLSALDATDQASLASAVTGRKRFNVSCRYILDVEIFNEWGNEADYDLAMDDEDTEVPTQAVAPSTRGRGGGRGRGRKSNAALASAALARPKSDSLPVQIQTHTDKLLPDALPATLQSSSEARVLDLTGDGLAVRTLPVANAALGEGVHTSASQAVKESTGDVLASDEASKKRRRDWLEEDAGSGSAAAAALPSSTELMDLKWLRLDGISALERRYMADLVPLAPSGETLSPAEVFYRDCRNALLQASAINPGQYLSATEARRKIAGDASKIMRIHTFLDAVGAINAKVKVEARPAALDEDWLWQMKREGIVAWTDLQFHHALPRADAPSGSVPFTKIMDEALATAVLQSKGSWGEVTKAMQALQPELTAAQCMVRFLELELQDPAAPAPAEASAKCEEEGLDGRREIEKTALRAVKLLQSLDCAMHQLLRQRAGVQIQCKVEGASEDSAMDVDDAGAAALRSLSQAASDQVTGVLETLRQAVVQRSDRFYQDVVGTRLDALEHKIRVFARMEALLQLERERVEIDKRDLLLRQIHSGVNPVTSAGATAPVQGTGLPSYGSTASLSTYR